MVYLNSVMLNAFHCKYIQKMFLKLKKMFEEILSFKTKFKIEFLLSGTGSKKKLGIMLEPLMRADLPCIDQVGRSNLFASSQPDD